jgi:hypothetical protein
MAVPRAVRHNPLPMFEIGASLREARTKRGFAPTDVQKALRIRERYLEALEEERWELLPGDAYAKGFLRSYADFLGLDGNLYVEEYTSRFGAAEDRPLAPAPLRRPERDRRSVGLLRPLIAIAVIVAIVAGVTAWQLNRGSKTGSPPTTTQTNPGGTHKTHHRRRPHGVLPTRAVLVASRGATWLEIRRGSPRGKLIYENTLPQGQTLQVPLTPGPVWMRVGLPANLDVRLGGKLVHGLPSQVGNVLLTRSGLKPARA